MLSRFGPQPGMSGFIGPEVRHGSDRKSGVVRAPRETSPAVWKRKSLAQRGEKVVIEFFNF